MTTGPQTPPPTPPEPQPPAPAPLKDVVVLLAVLVVLLVAGAVAYVMYAHPGAREPLGAALVVVGIFAPLMYSMLRR
ncbi:hypothetical protein [Streptomyces niveus]|uniref:hypothetical protein n=1 Tax=Streptomyces niveus TaxID=193462 RepID=UPI0003C5D204|nr:hypothetical protein [Streptomyces niveus]EST17906.1 hypothetical protein M877_40060 [Streptomyces niveus NCIMB 11891]